MMVRDIEQSIQVLAQRIHSFLLNGMVAGFIGRGVKPPRTLIFSQWGTTYKLGCNSNKEVTMAVKTGVPVSPTPFSNPTAPLDTVELESSIWPEMYPLY